MVRYYGMDAGLTLGGKRIFIVHYPHYAEAIATTGEWDIVCCGHDHRPAITPIATIKGGKTLMLNPGTVAGIGPQASYIIGDLDTMDFEIREVPLPEPRK